MSPSKPPGRGPFASIHNPNPVLHYGGALSGPSSARELGKARDPGLGELGKARDPGLDQGIDMALSPTGRESPGHESVSSSVSTDRGSQASSSTGCRNSTTSIDSGRGSSSTGRRSVLPGSSGHTDHIHQGDIHQMVAAGVPDPEVLTAWLTELHYEEYFHLFRAAGYDMPTISRMTPEDLTAVGIQNPAHRKRLKTEIARLNICDGLPEHVPGSLEEWLRLLRLEEYLPGLRDQGYCTVHQVASINIEDLEDLGFYRLGHQKRLVLAIRRLRDLQGPSPPRPPAHHLGPGPAPPPQACTAFSSFHAPLQPPASPFLGRRAPSGWPYPPPDPDLPPPMPALQYPLYQPGLHRGPPDGAALYPGSPRFTPRAAGGLGHPPAPAPPRMLRSYDDADLESRHRMDHSALVHPAPAGETLPRLKTLPRQQPRPVAKILGRERERDGLGEEILACDDWKSRSPGGTLRAARAPGDLQLKRNSSFDSESGIPFANEKAGTIRIRSNSAVRLPSCAAPDPGAPQPRRNAGDVLQDIGSMLSDLTDELDAMLRLDREEP